MQEHEINMLRLLAQDLDGHGSQTLLDMADKIESESKGIDTLRIQIESLKNLLNEAREAINELREAGVYMDGAWSKVVKVSPVVAYDADAGRNLNICRNRFMIAAGIVKPTETH